MTDRWENDIALGCCPEIELISSDGLRIPVSRAALLAESGYYKALVSSGMKDAMDTELNLQAVSGKGLDAVAKHLNNCGVQLKGKSETRQLLSIDESHTLESIEEFLLAASYLQILSIQQLCCIALQRLLSECTWPVVLDLSAEYGLPCLRDCVICYLQTNLASYGFAESFQRLSLTDVVSVLDSDDAQADEMDIFNIAVHWLSYVYCTDDSPSSYTHSSTTLLISRTADRCKCQRSSEEIEKIMSVVRFPLMTSCDLQGCRDVLVSRGFLELCDRFIQSALWYQEDIRRLRSSTDRVARIRNTVQTIVITGGFTPKERSTMRFQILPIDHLLEGVGVSSAYQSLTDNQSSDSSQIQFVHKVDDVPQAMGVASVCQSLPKENSPTNEIQFRSRLGKKLPSTLCEHGACVLNNVLYVAGGQIRYCTYGLYTTNLVHCFDPRVSEWKQCASMHVPRSLFHLGVLDGSMYAIAGWTAPTQDTPTVEHYSVSEDTWTMITSLPIDVHELGGCSHGGYLYVSGGFRGPEDGHVDTVWRLHPPQSTSHKGGGREEEGGRHTEVGGSYVWEQRASMLTPRSYHAMAVVCGYIVVAGGVRYVGDDKFTDILSCEMYSPTLDQWTHIAYLPHVASCMPNIVLGRSLYLFGGHSFETDTDHSLVQALTLCSSTLPNGGNKNADGTLVVDGDEKSKVDNLQVVEFLPRTAGKFDAQRILHFAACIVPMSRAFVAEFH